jgi:hypothetical protein
MLAVLHVKIGQEDDLQPTMDVGIVRFDFKGISISSSFYMDERIYKDAGGHKRTRFDREVSLYVSFWDFDLQDGNLYELAFIRSILHYFMQAYWKRSSKEGSRIELAKVLSRKDYKGEHKALCFVAKQKDKKNYLQIYHTKKGETVKEVYLDGQEVIILDIALGKAINLLTPTSDKTSDIFGS